MAIQQRPTGKERKNAKGQDLLDPKRPFTLRESSISCCSSFCGNYSLSTAIGLPLLIRMDVE